MKNVILLLAFTLHITCYSQNEATQLHNLISNDSSSAQVLFSYPDSIRYSILIASAYPQTFVKLNEIQKKTSTSFKNTISKCSKARQKQFWEIARYPELASLLIKNKDKSKKELNAILINYPKETKKASQYFIKHDYNAIVQMKTIKEEFDSNYNDLVKDFLEDVKKSFNKILGYPELVSILYDDIKTTTSIGELYKSKPVLVKHISDSIHQQITKTNNMEFEDWKNGIKNDPNVQSDMKQIFDKYKDEEYVDDIYATGKEENSKKVESTKTTESSEKSVMPIISPYPYWAGYPYWYDYPYWYPYSWPYNIGFYSYPNQPFFFFGMPSYQFGWWFYNYPYYYNRYPNATNYFYNHYQGHRNSYGGFNNSIRDWNNNGGAGGGGRRGGDGGGGNSGGGGRRR